MSDTPRCRYCGKQVRWVKREDGSVHPPLVMVGEAIVVRNNIACVETVYVQHYCRDEEVLAYEKIREDFRQGVGPSTIETDRIAEQRLLMEQVSMTRDLAWTNAIDHPCPKCFAEPGEQCENLAKRAKGIAAYTSWPHTERVIEPSTDEQGDQKQ